MAKKRRQDATQAEKPRRLVKNSEKDKRYEYIEDNHDRRTEVGHKRSFDEALDLAVKSDEEHGSDDDGELKRDWKEYDA